MAGHSKWANIRYRKSMQDAKRGKLFTKYIREITISARLGGGDSQANPRLRAVLDKALGANMTRDTIDRAIKRGVGDLDGEALEEIRYEGYGPGGIAIIVDCMTDNRKRTVSEVRHAFSKHGGNLGTDGSVAYLFSHIGQFIFAPCAHEDKIMELSLEHDALDVMIDNEGSIEVQTSVENFQTLRSAFEKEDLKYEQAELTMSASLLTALDEEASVKIIKLIDHLEDLDDVQVVYSNADLASEAFNE